MSGLGWQAPNCRLVSGAIDARSASCCSGKDSLDRVDGERANVATVQSIGYRRPVLVCRTENAAAKTCSCKNVPTRIGRQRPNIHLDDVMTNFQPTVSIITLAVDAAGAADSSQLLRKQFVTMARALS
jgi:hypothetical protein